MNKKLTLFFFVILLLPFAVNAHLRFNEITGMYYSEGARKNVNPIEYHVLVLRCIQFAQANPYHDVSSLLIAELKQIGSHAALRLIHDIKKGH